MESKKRRSGVSAERRKPSFRMTAALCRGDTTSSTFIPLGNERACVEEMVSGLLAWFPANARDLPWRRTRDPYAIWVSEIMLQQTQVKTVIPFWERWMRELPDIKSLARAAEARIHKLWEGLGYYTRVRNMQKAAREIIRNHGGKFPEDFDRILELPGIGRYTAGAISSIAFNQPRPVLDGNVIRVLTRVFGIRGNPRDKETNARLWRLAEELVGRAAGLDSEPGGRTGVMPVSNRTGWKRCATNVGTCSALNQALMELGALVCTPRAPDCEACPLTALCIARKLNLQEALPNVGKRIEVSQRRFIAFLVERSGKFLVRQRPAGVVNAHLWEFPNFEINPATRRASASRASPVTKFKLPSTNSFAFTASKPLCVIKHSITRYRITLEAWHADERNCRAKLDGHWFSRKQLQKLAFASAHRRILAQL